MTYVKTDPTLMTPAELADYHRREGIPLEQPAETDDDGVTVPVPFDQHEITRVRERSTEAGEDVATWVHEAALHEAGVANATSGDQPVS